MEVRSLELPLTGFGVPSTSAHVEFLDLNTLDRLKRGAVAFGLGLAVAVVALPIPLVHLILVPAALILGVVFGMVRAQQQQVFRTVQARCPFCGNQQSFSVMGRFRLPKQLSCAACHRQLLLQPTSEQPHSPT